MGALYILLTAIVIGLAWMGRSLPAIRLAHWLLFDCVSTNLAVGVMGFLHAPLLIPSLDALVAIAGVLPIALALEVRLPPFVTRALPGRVQTALAFIGVSGAPADREPSSLALVVFGLFVAVGFVHAVAYTTHREGTFGYYLLLNLLFAAQVLVVGGVGGYRYLSHRPPPSLRLPGGASPRG